MLKANISIENRIIKSGNKKLTQYGLSEINTMERNKEMKIIVHEEINTIADSYLKLLKEKYNGKISKIITHKRIIKLINGDEIRIVTDMFDGLRADVAIGNAAKVLTLASKEENPIWTINDLKNYLENIKEIRCNNENSISVKVLVDTTEIDLALEKVNKLYEIINKISQASEGLKYLNNLTDKMKKMSCQEKQYWFEDLKMIANIIKK